MFLLRRENNQLETNLYSLSLSFSPSFFRHLFSRSFRTPLFTKREGVLFHLTRFFRYQFAKPIIHLTSIHRVPIYSLKSLQYKEKYLITSNQNPTSFSHSLSFSRSDSRPFSFHFTMFLLPVLICFKNRVS